MFVARLRNCSDAPLHVLPVEFELCFGDVVVVLLDGLGVIGALLVGGGLGGEVWRAPAFGLALCDVFAPSECVFAEASGALDGDDGDLVAGRHFAWVLGRLVGLGDVDADACVRVGVLAVVRDGGGLLVEGAVEDGGRGEVDGFGYASFSSEREVWDLAVDASVVCGHDAALLAVHHEACALRVSREDGVGVVVCPFAASAAVGGLRPEDV